MSRARDLAALVIPELFQQNAGRNQLGLGTDTINAKIQVSGAVSATTYYGDGSNLTGINLDPGSSQSITNLNVTGVSTFGDINISAGSTVFGGDFSNSTFTGVTIFAGQVSAAGTTGRDGQVLISVGSGVSWQDPVGIRSEVFIDAVEGQVQFNFTHDPNALDVFINGIKLDPDEYSSDGGTVVSISTATDAGDIVNLVGYGVSGYQGQVGSLTVKDDGQTVGNVGGINILNFEGRDTSVVGGGNSVTVNIPNRKGFVDSRELRAYVSHDDVGAGSSLFSFLPIASSITYDNTDVYVAGYKQYIDMLDLGYSKYVGVPTSASTGSDVIIVGYKDNDVRAGIASTATQDQIVFNFPFTGIGTPGSIASGKPIDVYYTGVKLVENETYVSVYGNSITLDPSVNVFRGDIGDIFSYVDQAKVGIVTIVATENERIINFPETSSSDVDIVINGVKLPYRNNVGLTSVIDLEESTQLNDGIVINSYDSANIPQAKVGINTRTVGFGETVLFGTLEDEHFVNGVKIYGRDIDSVGVTSIVSLRNVPEVGSIAENLRFADGARVGLATISAVSVGQTIFSDTSVTFNKDDVDVFYNGVKLTASEFSIVGTSSTVTLESGADAVGDILEVVRWNLGARYGISTFSASNLLDPSLVYLNTAILEDGTEFAVAPYNLGSKVGLTTITSTAPQSVISVTYTPGNEEVYVNGVKLLKGTEYTATNGTSITLINSTVVGDTIEVVQNAAGAVTGINTITAVGLQTGFAGDYISGYNDVFFNGIRLRENDEYQGNGPSEIYIPAGAVAGDRVEIIAYSAAHRQVGYTTTLDAGDETVTYNATDKVVQIFVDGVKYNKTDFVVGFARTDFTITDPTKAIATNQVFLNGVKLDGGGANPEYTILDGIAVGAGITVVLTQVVEPTDTLEIVGINTDAMVTNRNETTATISEFYTYEIDDHTGSQETYVNGIRVLGAERDTYGAGEYILLSQGGMDGSIYETFSYASGVRVGLTTISTAPSFTLNTAISAPGVGAGITEFIVDSVANVTVGSSMIITGAGSTFAGGVEVVSVGSTSVFIGTASTISDAIAAGVAVTITSSIGSSVYSVAAPLGVPDNDVYVDGILQAPSLYSSDYTVGGGTTITLNDAPEIGSVIEVVGIATTARSVNEHTSTADQSIFEIGHHNGDQEVFINGVRQTQSGISSTYGPNTYVILEDGEGYVPIAGDEIEVFDYATWTRTGVTTFSATEGQTEFTVGIPTGTADNDVYLNGVRLTESNYSVIGGGATIGLTTAANAGDYVEVVGIATTARVGVATERVFAVNGQTVIPIGDSSTNIEVFINGIRYFNDQFTTNLDSLLIDTNPYGVAAQADDHIELIEYNSDGQQLARSEANYRAFPGQTEFQVEYQDVKLLDVYVNGLLVSPNDYVAETGTNIVLNVPLNAGDLVQLIAYTVTEIAEWTKTSVGIYQTAPYVGVGTTALGNYQLEVGYPGIAGTSLWVNGNARVTGILTVGDTNTIAIDGQAQQIRIGDTIINSSGIAATSFTGDVVGTASTAESLTPTASINTSGIITATGGFVGDVVGTAISAITALGFAADVSINSTGILTATKVDAGIGSFRDTVVSGAITATTVSATSIVGPLTGNVTGTATGLSGAPNIVVTVATAGTFIGNLTGTASTAENALGLSTSANINTTGIITATFIGDLTGTATTATTALGFTTTGSINTSGIITAGTFVGDLTGTVNGTASVAQVALGITNTQIGIVSATEAIIAGFTTFGGSVGIDSGNLTVGGNIDLTQNNGRLRFGPSDELQMYVNAGNAYIEESGAGSLFVKSNIVSFRNAADSEQLALFTQDGAIELFHNNTKRFETVALGATVTGSLEVTQNLNVTGLGTILGNVRLDADLTLQGDNNTIGIGTGYSVGVGTLTPAADAILELKSTDKFFIVPRLTTAQRDGVASTTAGAIIYNTTDNRHQGYNGTTWNNFYV